MTLVSSSFAATNSRVPMGLPRTTSPCCATGRLQSPRQHDEPSSSAKAHRHAAYWASWADTVGALREFHPQVLANLLRPIPMLGEAAAMPPSTRQAEYAAEWLRSQGFAAPTWASLLDGAAPPHGADADGGGPVAMQKGWQRCAGAAVEKSAREMFFSNLDSASRALLLSQCGPGASSCSPTLGCLDCRPGAPGQLSRKGGVGNKKKPRHKGENARRATKTVRDQCQHDEKEVSACCDGRGSNRCHHLNSVRQEPVGCGTHPVSTTLCSWYLS